MEDGIAGFFMGLAIGALIIMAVVSNFGTVPKASELRTECESDLARNLKCEMVYVKQE